MAPQPKRKPDWRIRAYAACEGRLMGAIIRAVAFTDAEFGPEPPRFVGRASITSDGFVMCDFVSRDERYHHGALVGAVSDLTRNTKALADHLALSDKDREALYDAVRKWIAVDYRDRPGLDFT